MLKQVKFMGLLLILALTIAACGGASDSGGTSDSVQEADEPPTRTPFPTFEFVAPTNPPVFNQSAEATESADSGEEAPEIVLDERAVSRGQGRYDALMCATCHGEAGVGTDEFEGLINYDGTLDEFNTFMRTGGTIGNSHQYSTNRLSDNGSNNLYQYILSLKMDE